MLWALLFSLLLNNDTSIILSNFDKGVKKHIVDDNRRSEILDLRKDSEKQHKAYMKERRKRLKAFDKLNKSRTSTYEEFNTLLQKNTAERKEFQKIEAERFMTINSIATSEEWQLLFSEFEEVEKNQLKTKKKTLKIVKKHFTTSINKVNKKIEDKEKREIIHHEINLLSELSLNYVHVYHKGIDKMIELIPSDNLSEASLLNILQEVNQAEDSAFSKAIDSHFIIREQTTKNEWKKLMKEIIKL